MLCVVGHFLLDPAFPSSQFLPVTSPRKPRQALQGWVLCASIDPGGAWAHLPWHTDNDTDSVPRLSPQADSTASSLTSTQEAPDKGRAQGAHGPEVRGQENILLHSVLTEEPRTGQIHRRHLLHGSQGQRGTKVLFWFVFVFKERERENESKRQSEREKES